MSALAPDMLEFTHITTASMYDPAGGRAPSLCAWGSRLPNQHVNVVTWYLHTHLDHMLNESDKVIVKDQNKSTAWMSQIRLNIVYNSRSCSFLRYCFLWLPHFDLWDNVWGLAWVFLSTLISYNRIFLQVYGSIWCINWFCRHNLHPIHVR
jgi:hypothetical protein